MKPLFTLAALFLLTSLGAPTAQAQNAAPAPAATTAPIGPAPANTKQHQIIASALSPETRQTLQQAMDSVPQK